LKIRGTCGTSPVRLLHRTIPTVTWFDSAKNPQVSSKIGLVQHGGGNPSGEFCYTLTMTDVKTGRTVHFALLNKAAAWVTQALDRVSGTLPMGLKGIHSDTGNENLSTSLPISGVSATVSSSPADAPPSKTTTAMSSKKIMPPSAKLSAISAAKAPLLSPPSGPSVTPIPPA
jgi:hypothetical protein